LVDAIIVGIKEKAGSTAEITNHIQKKARNELEGRLRVIQPIRRKQTPAFNQKETNACLPSPNLEVLPPLSRINQSNHKRIVCWRVGQTSRLRFRHVPSSDVSRG
jgi:hypothetical protein